MGIDAEADLRTARRAARRGTRSLVATIVVCFSTLFIVFGVIPGAFIRTDSLASGGAVIAQRDGRDTAIIAYHDAGASIWDRWITHNAGGLRLIAIDIQTGEGVWDVGVGDEFDRDWKLIGASDENVFLRTTFETWVFAVDDGSEVARGEDIPTYADVSFNQGVQVHLEGSDEILFRLPDDPDGTLRTLDMNSLDAGEADPEFASTWWCAVGRSAIGYSLPFALPPVMSNTVLPTGWSDDGYAERMTVRPPVTGACADAIWEEDLFPDGQDQREVVESGGHRLVSAGDGALDVVEIDGGEVVGSTSPMTRLRSAVPAAGGGMVLVADRELTGIAPSVWRETSSSVVYTIAADGTVHETILGAHGWFGLPWRI